ncbi:MAG: DUF4922 domain-containing protein [Bacteroides sp.]|nr:DUF4922 domain-containing protein [Bacteroides sp.]
MTLQYAKNIIDRQCEAWSLCRDNYSALHRVEKRELSDTDGRHVTTLLHNPARIGSSAACPASERPCFLCYGNRPVEQTAIMHGDYEILVNPFPIFPIHFTISHRNHIPQTISGNFQSMLEFCDIFPELTVFYNGPECGASAPDHHHFQAANFQFPQADGKAEIACGQNFIQITSASDDFILEKFGQLLNILPQHTPEPMMNILSRRLDAGRKCVTVFPRLRHRPSCYGEIIVSPASVEMAGYMVTPRKADFDTITARKAKEIIEEVSLTPQEIKELCNRLSQ